MGSGSTAVPHSGHFSFPTPENFLPFTKKEKSRGWVERESAASELRHCLRQSSREFHWLGVRGPPFQYSCSGQGAAAEEVTSVRGGGSCVVTIWLPRSTTLLGCLFRGCTSHQPPHHPALSTCQDPASQIGAGLDASPARTQMPAWRTQVW